MRTAAFALLSLAVLLGGLLLTPALPASGPARRSVVAAVHGSLGAAGLAVLAWALGGAPHVHQVIWSGVVLVSLGFAAGLTLAVLWWIKRKPPALVLPLHVIFAGLGYLILAGLVLTT